MIQGGYNPIVFERAGIKEVVVGLSAQENTVTSSYIRICWRRSRDASVLEYTTREGQMMGYDTSCVNRNLATALPAIRSVERDAREVDKCSYGSPCVGHS